MLARTAGTIRALFSFVSKALDETQRVLMERLYTRRMAVRRMFLSDPRNPNSEFSRDGRLLLDYLGRRCHVLAPVQTSDPIELARVNGMQTALGFLLADLFDDLPDFARMMAQEEAKRREEIIA